jgi:hypothetical protein
LKWVKHDTDANQDAKLQNVLLDYGLEGYGLYWYCIELIASKVDKDNITFELEHDARIIARNTGSSSKKVEEMMIYFVKSGLFENSSGVITCLKLAKRLDKSMTSNPEMRNIIDLLRNKSHDKVMTESEIVMQDKNRLDKNRKDKDSCALQAPAQKKVPYDEILNLYHEILPSLPRVKIKTEARIKSMKARHITNLNSNLENWEGYFTHIRDNCTWMLSGQYSIDFDYIITLKNYVKILEGTKNDR